VFVPFGPTASMTSNSYNFTDLRTMGARVELAKQLGGGAHILTYGVDAFRDLSEGTDSSVTTITGFGPPNTTRSNRPSIPNATFRSAGVFAQLELNPFSRLTTVVGGRVQNVSAETKATPNTDAVPTTGSDRTAVWSANALYRVTENLNLLTSVGRGFRAPNLVERFFEGRVVESNSYQYPNADLAPETSINVDVGARYRLGPWFAEGFVFRNTINDVIKAEATGETVNGAPAYQNRNIGRMRIDGLELLTGVRAGNGLGATLSWTRFDGKNITEPDAPIGDSYSSKLVGDVAWRQPAGRFMVGFTTRHQGEQRETIVGTNPIGPVIPAFTVHSARASVLLLERAGITNRLSFTLDNIGNTLYAEFPNASFFRPEAGRSVTVALVTGF
jgi:hemoglobin/transferrin/lactoferrin receptor protein